MTGSKDLLLCPYAKSENTCSVTLAQTFSVEDSTSRGNRDNIILTTALKVEYGCNKENTSVIALLCGGEFCFYYHGFGPAFTKK